MEKKEEIPDPPTNTDNDKAPCTDTNASCKKVDLSSLADHFVAAPKPASSLVPDSLCQSQPPVIAKAAMKQGANAEKRPPARSDVLTIGAPTARTPPPVTKKGGKRREATSHLQTLSRLPPALPWGVVRTSGGPRPSGRPVESPPEGALTRGGESGGAASTSGSAGPPVGYSRLPTGACRTHERLKPVLRWNLSCFGPNGTLLADLGQHFKASEIASLLRCMLAPLLSLRVGKVVREGRKLCPTRARGTLNVVILAGSELRIYFVGDSGFLERVVTTSAFAEGNSAKLDILPADPSGRTFSLMLPSGRRTYFWNSEKDLAAGQELVSKLKSLVESPPTLSELTGISNMRLDALSEMLRAGLAAAAASEPRTAPHTSHRLSTPLAALSLPSSEHPLSSRNSDLPPSRTRGSERMMGWPSTSGSRERQRAIRSVEGSAIIEESRGPVMRRTSEEEPSSLRRGFFGSRRGIPQASSSSSSSTNTSRGHSSSKAPLEKGEAAGGVELGRGAPVEKGAEKEGVVVVEDKEKRRLSLGSAVATAAPVPLPKFVTNSNLSDLLGQTSRPGRQLPTPLSELVCPAPVALNLDSPNRPTTVTCANLSDVVRRHLTPAIGTSPKSSPKRDCCAAETAELEPPSPACLAGGVPSPQCHRRDGDCD